MPERTIKQPKSDEIVAIVDDSGRVQGQFVGQGAREDAQEFLKDAVGGGIKHLRGASIVDGEKAKKAILEGRI